MSRAAVWVEPEGEFPDVMTLKNEDSVVPLVGPQDLQTRVEMYLLGAQRGEGRREMCFHSLRDSSKEGRRGTGNAGAGGLGQGSQVVSPVLKHRREGVGW